ncbi:4-oxalocrotonate tautomerase DmpI [Candidatus Enterococcus moelleringii]|uniref:4-oxalocrotonate tautomerase DmpI n=1 Tax=Candidatus Enterococcus moelleringii TaxID=2815325 RepID=UPI001F6127CE|nr:4-oxalocrotonate tautomerase DmpI [Enterococcus sp. 669A]
MPIIRLESTKLSKEQKEQLVKDFTKNAARIMEKPEAAFHVMIQEYDSDNVGVGGQLLSERRKNE